MSADSDASPGTSISANSPEKKRQWWKWLLRLAFGIVIIGLLLRRYDRDGAQLRELLGQVAWHVLPASIVVYWCTQMVSARRWQILLNKSISESLPGLPLFEACRIYLSGMFWNLWMPTGIGGDTVRTYLASRRGIPLSEAATSVFADRLIGFITLLSIGFCGLLGGALNSTQRSYGTHYAWLGAGLFLVVVGALVAIRAIAFRLERRWPEHRVVKTWARLHRLLDLYTAPRLRGTVGAALLLSVVVQTGQILLNIFLARAVGLDVPAGLFFAVVPLLGIAIMIPAGIGGLGVREAAAVALLSGTGANEPRIIAWSLLWQATVWLASLPGILTTKLGRADS